MCLKLKNDVHQYIAESDIICYKHIIKRSDYKSRVTTYRYFPVKIGTTYESNIKVIFSTGYSTGYEINVGLHSFKSKSDCVDDSESEEGSSYLLKTYICECVIPKGSKYYVGSFCGWEGYASDKLKYRKILETKIIREPETKVKK